MDNENINKTYPQDNAYSQNNTYSQVSYSTPNYASQSTYYQQPVQNKPLSALAVTSLVLGILSLTLCCCIGWLPGIIGAILGIVAIAKDQGGKGLAVGGVITSVLGLIIGILLTVYTVAIVNSNEFEEGFKEGFEESYYDSIVKRQNPPNPPFYYVCCTHLAIFC